MEQYNKQASEYIFRENNANGRVAADTIDLHGQFVEEAEEILEERIKYAKSHGQSHLHVYVCTPPYPFPGAMHVFATNLLPRDKRKEKKATNTKIPSSIVGKGNHSAGHVQKIKPRVEQVCQELGLKYATEDNAGRIYVNLTGGEAVIPDYPSHQAPHQGGSYGGYPGQQQGHQQQGHQQHQQQQQPQQQDEVEKIVNALLPKVMRKLEKACCVVM
jgi:hypothetical protein